MFGGSKRNGNAMDTRASLRDFRCGGAGRKGCKKKNPALGGVSFVIQRLCRDEPFKVVRAGHGLPVHPLHGGQQLFPLGYFALH